MRITNSMMVSTMMRNLNNNLNRMDKIQMQMATGKRINKPSDDPVGMAKVLTLSSDVAANEQYKKNVDEALSWLETTEIAVTQLKDVMQRVRELTVRGATGTLAPEDKQAIQKEITQLKDQVVSIGNSTYAGRYIFAGFNTINKPFTLEETAAGTQLVYNGRMVSPGGIVGENIAEADFINFLINPNNKELTMAQTTDSMMIEIGMGNLMNVNINGPELFQKGFGGIFETLTKLENVLQEKENYQHGFVDMRFQGDLGTLDLDNAAGDKMLQIKMGEDVFTINFPQQTDPLTIDQIQKSIDSIPHLKKNGVTIAADGTISADQKFTLLSSTLSSNTFPLEADPAYAPLLIGKRLEGSIETTTGQGLIVNGTSIPLHEGKKYDLDSRTGKEELLRDIRALLPSPLQVDFTADNRLQFRDAHQTAAPYDTIVIQDIGGFLTNLGFTDGQQSKQADIKTEKLNTSAMLADLDINMENILAKLSEIGAKTNRLELDQSRLEDNIINYKNLLSKTEDADMAEVIMKLKMEENVYRASLSSGARIIQPSLIDFLR
ncbi:flagellar hook-associated protein 3 [Geosporobacter subterraneus DSM 17957]|uniref:Flagellar hook-associated protein 3 n=1 Tax=Geosporobacter subterraneus DSM 17957 TaxID=1121919 RepID=A0A1M6CMV7_9FIRM|nr:flagellar hook-associated protein FlgL [Geosporobacter subterraneus]SHI62038.1 flagellar hook-associated protein 3 [Geosporobacter subterraneus DSM 17957]